VTALRVLAARGLEGGSGFALAGVHRFLFLLLVVLLPLAYLAMTPLLAADRGETLVVLGQLAGMVLLFGGVLLAAPRAVRWLGRPVLAILARRAPLIAVLADRSLARDAGRFAASVCGLAVVLLAYVGLEHLTASLRGEVEQFGADAMTYRVFVAGPPVTPEVAASVADLPGVRSVEPFEGQVAVPFPLSGLAVEHLLGDGRPFAGDPARADRYAGTRSLVISKRLARLRGLAVGDFVAVPTDEGARAYEVLAVGDAPGFFPDERAFAVTAPHWLVQDFCLPAAAVERIAVTIEPGRNPWEVMAGVSERLPHVTWRKTGAEIVAYLLRDVTRDFFLFEVLLAMILVLAGVGLVNSMTLTALGRAREIGVLRALGMTNRTLRALFLAEGLVVACLASLLALLLSLPLGFVLVRGLGRVAGLDAPLVVPWQHLALVPVFALVVGLLSALVPGMRAVREDPAVAVRYE
jgi:putative ABC transport system permease protein